MIKALVFDWAGTTIDYGCFSPLGAFVLAFKEFGLDLSLEDARKPMGMLKRDHTIALLEMPHIREQFVKKHRRELREDDVDKIYQSFEDNIFTSLKDYVDLNPYVLQTVQFLRDKNIKIGSTTGYTKKMMDLILPLASQKGYEVDCCVSSDELGYGRPYPYMMYECARRLNVYPQSTIVKVGDTPVDMQEGKNAGCMSIGLVLGSSTLGLSREEVERGENLEALKNKARVTLYEAGADVVIDDLSFLPEALEMLERKMRREIC